MTGSPPCVGIDVSKDHLDVHRHPDGLAFRVTNTPAGIRKLLNQLGEGPYAIGCEATGGYENRLLLALSEAGRPGYCLHPADVRAFTRLKGRRAKTDRLDARAIAEALRVALDTRKPLRRTRAAAAIKEMVTVRRTLIATINDLKSLLARIETPQARKPLQAMLETHKQALKAIARTIRDALAADPAIAETVKRILSAPGAGPVLAAELIASMPELGSLSSRQAASLLGVAPHPRQSGSLNKPGRCQAGRPTIRRVLYMATLSAIKARLQPLYPFYQRMRTAGKPFKVAIVAAMRKFIVMLNAMIKNNADWNPNHAT
jgi:transposase